MIIKDWLKEKEWSKMPSGSYLLTESDLRELCLKACEGQKELDRLGLREQGIKLTKGYFNSITKLVEL